MGCFFLYRPTFGPSLVIRDGRHPILVHMSQGSQLKPSGRKKSPAFNVGNNLTTVVANDIIATCESRYYFFS